MRIKVANKLITESKMSIVSVEALTLDKKFDEAQEAFLNFSNIADELDREIPYAIDKDFIDQLAITLKKEIRAYKRLFTNNIVDKKNEDKIIESNIAELTGEIFTSLNEKHIIIQNILKQQEKHNFEYVYAIGLPKYEYFDDIANFTKDLNFIFKTVIGKEEKAKLVGFDVGSEWYLVGFDTYIAFKAFGAFVKESYKFLKRKKEDADRIEGLSVDDESRKKLEEALLISNQIYIQDGVNKLARLKNTGDELTPEEMSYNLKAIELFSGMLEEGTKVDVDRQPTGKNSNQPKMQLPSSDHLRNLLESSSALFLEDNSDSE
ncbi:hypothetical protein ACIQ1D_18390 [Lysinibacillus xylanilyticus]|uniref:hypothetical protein n=1 Tax=Lysinibacillus xylanilyticus TaxID=582475 RepID=UPI0037FDF137